MSNSQNTVTVGRTTLTFGVRGPAGPDYPQQLFNAELIEEPTLEATNDFLRAPAADATDAANTAAALANTKAALADQKAQAAQVVVDAGANILAANVQTTLNAGIVQALVSQPDFSQKSTIDAIVPPGLIAAGAVDMILDGRGRAIQGNHSTGRAVFRKADPTGKQDGPIIPTGFHPLAAELVLDGRGRPIHAVNSVGASLYGKAATPPAFFAPAGVIPQGADPSVTVDGRGRMVKPLTSTPAVSLAPLPPGLPVAGGIVDGHGQPMPGSVNPISGLFQEGPEAAAYGIAYLTGTSPNRQVRAWLRDKRDILISMPGSDPDMFVQKGNTISYRRTAGGILGDTAMSESESIHPEPLPMSTSAFAYGPFLGQSNSNGYGLAVQVYSSKPVRPGRARMFARGPRIQSDSVIDGTGLPVSFEALATLRDLCEVPEYDPAYVIDTSPSRGFPKETPCSGAGWQMTAAGALPSTTMFVTSTCGVGSAQIANLSKGKRPYWNLIRSVWTMVVKAAVRNVPCTVPAIFYVQGESDATQTLAYYTNALDALQTNLDTDIRALLAYWTPQAAPVILAAVQTSSWTQAGIARSDITNAILNLSIANPSRFMPAGVMFDWPYEQPVHLSAYGHEGNGERMANMLARKLNGVTHPEIYCTGLTVDNTAKTITLHYSGFQTGPMFDTTLISDPGNYGIVSTQTGGAGEAISSISISGNDIVLQMTAIPTGTNRAIEIGMYGTIGAWGGPTTGPRHCIRDIFTFTRRDGTPGYLRAQHQTIYY